MIMVPFLISFVFAILTLALSFQSPVKILKLTSLLAPVFYIAGVVAIMRHIDQFGPVAMYMGQWSQPFGISFYIDHFSALLLLLTGFLYFVGLLYASEDRQVQAQARYFYPLIHFLIMGVTGAFSTGDYFNMYVWYEVMILSSFGLLSIGQSHWLTEGTLKYAVLNFLASTFFLMGLGLLYAQVGSLDIRDVGLRLSQMPRDLPVILIAILMGFGFAIKAGVFPLYSWLPTSYPVTNVTSSAVFAGLLTKVGVYSLFRLFASSFAGWGEILSPSFLPLVLLTMLFGVWGAATQYHIRRILSFHIVSQIGYILIPLVVLSTQALAAAIFYLGHHILVKSNLFFIAGMLRDEQRQEDLKQMGGGLKQTPYLAFLFIVSGFSLGGIPPLSGFLAKWSILKAAYQAQHFWIVGLGIFVGWLTLYSMTKIWSMAFWGQTLTRGGASSHTEELERLDGSSRRVAPDVACSTKWARYLAMSLLVLGTLSITFFPDPWMRWSEKAALEVRGASGGLHEVNQ